MDEPKSLDSLFKEKIFRIPDYQRGYAWQRPQLKAFWEDLVNLSEGRSHYTGVLTLKEIPPGEVKPTDKEFWLVDDHSYRIYHIVDGQQRLTTFIIFIQAFVDFLRSLPENEGKAEGEVFLTDTQTVADVGARFLCKTKPTGDQFRTYKFGYTEDNPSYEYMRYCILGEDGGGSVQETFYTLNLSNAKRYFAEQLAEVHGQEGSEGWQDLYKKLTKRFLFNEYVIKEEFNVFVAFETMNNRGKPLSDLELLKNRLIYLTTLYGDDELDPASRQNLRETINDAWKEVYKQLGRNKNYPLNDDDFLRAHWILYFKYSRKTGRDYIDFLLNSQFTPQRVHRKVEREVILEAATESRDAEEPEEEAMEEAETEEAVSTATRAELSPTEIRDYVLSLKASAVHWFNTFFPSLAGDLDPEMERWLNALNRVGIAYFRPLVMALLKRDLPDPERVDALKAIERTIFVLFRMNEDRANYGSSKFYRMVRSLDRKEVDVAHLIAELDDLTKYAFDETSRQFKHATFLARCEKRLKSGNGFYAWPGLRYFLFEYELNLLTGSRQQKVTWEDLKKSERDMVTIEHVYPQTPTPYWDGAFEAVPEERRANYQSSLGNLLLLSRSINSALQNDSFEEKKAPKFSEGRKVRNGYSDGSHSEIEVATRDTWGPEQIKDRGLELLRFLETRWNIRLGGNESRLHLLGLETENSSPEVSGGQSTETRTTPAT